MSIQSLLNPTPPNKPWANLYINDLAAHEIDADILNIDTVNVDNLAATNFSATNATLTNCTCSALNVTSSLTATSLTANSSIILDSSKRLASIPLTNGQLQIGSSGNQPFAGNLTGTANQIIVTNGAGSITLSTPQNIGTASTPTFGNTTINGKITVTTQPFIFYKVTAQSIPNSSDTALLLNTLVAQAGTEIVNNMNGTFTCTNAGIYSVTCYLSYASNNTGVRTVTITSSAYPGSPLGTVYIPALNALSTTTINSSFISYYPAGNIFSVTSTQTSGGNLNLDSNISICKLT